LAHCIRIKRKQGRQCISSREIADVLGYFLTSVLLLCLDSRIPSVPGLCVFAVFDVMELQSFCICKIAKFIAFLCNLSSSCQNTHDESSSHRTHRICCCSSEASHSHGCFYCTVDEIEHRWVLNEQVYLVNVFMLRSRAMENRIFSTCELVFTSV